MTTFIAMRSQVKTPVSSVSTVSDDETTASGGKLQPLGGAACSPKAAHGKENVGEAGTTATASQAEGAEQLVIPRNQGEGGVPSTPPATPGAQQQQQQHHHQATTSVTPSAQQQQQAATPTTATGGRKGTPWTEAEHMAFLDGLKVLGKGNWRGISKKFVPTRTPTQVASHAQKHFLRVTGATKRKSRFTALEQAFNNSYSANIYNIDTNKRKSGDESASASAAAGVGSEAGGPAGAGTGGVGGLGGLGGVAAMEMDPAKRGDAVAAAAAAMGGLPAGLSSADAAAMAMLNGNFGVAAAMQQQQQQMQAQLARQQAEAAEMARRQAQELEARRQALEDARLRCREQ